MIFFSKTQVIFSNPPVLWDYWMCEYFSSNQKIFIVATVFQFDHLIDFFYCYMWQTSPMWYMEMTVCQKVVQLANTVWPGVCFTQEELPRREVSKLVNQLLYNIYGLWYKPQWHILLFDLNVDLQKSLESLSTIKWQMVSKLSL